MDTDRLLPMFSVPKILQAGSLRSGCRAKLIFAKNSPPKLLITHLRKGPKKGKNGQILTP